MSAIGTLVLLVACARAQAGDPGAPLPPVTSAQESGSVVPEGARADAAAPAAQLSTQDPPAPGLPQSAAVAAPSTQLPPQPDDLVYGYTRYKAELDGLVRDFPGRVRLERVGESRQGRDLWLVVASDERGRDAALKPALLVCSELDAPDGGAAAARALLDTARRLLSRAASEPRIEALLQDHAVYLAPALDPDRAFGENRARGGERDAPPRLSVDFPIDWHPQPDRFTPYPLSEPESRSVAELLRSRSNLSAVLMFASRPRSPLSPNFVGAAEAASLGTSLARRAQAALFARAAGDASAIPRPYADLARAPGSLEAYCEGRLGQLVFVCEPWGMAVSGGEPLGAAAKVGEPGADVSGALRIALDLAAGLPRLECDPPIVERLRADLWLVDVSVRNSGLLPTAIESASERRSALGVRLRTSGARVVGIASRRGGGGFESLSCARDAWLLGHLEGGDGLTVRLVVEAQENSALELTFDAPRAGERVVSVPLL